MKEVLRTKACFGEYLKREAKVTVSGLCSLRTLRAETSDQNQMRESQCKKHAFQRQEVPGTIPDLPFS